MLDKITEYLEKQKELLIKEKEENFEEEELETLYKIQNLQKLKSIKH